MNEEELLAKGRAEVIRWLREKGHSGSFYADEYAAEYQDKLPICQHQWKRMEEDYNADYEECNLCLVYRKFTT